MPTEWYTIVNAEAVESFTTSLTKRGVSPVFDVIFNHRSGTEKSACNNDWTLYISQSG